MKAKHIVLLLLLSGCLLPMGCARRQTAAVITGEALSFDKGQVWQLVTLRGKEVPASSAATLMLHPESGTLRGHVACNRYFADYQARLQRTDADGSRYSLDIQYVSGGDVQCPEGDMTAQQRYLTLLDKADACLLTPYTLTFFQRGKEILKYELQ